MPIPLDQLTQQEALDQGYTYSPNGWMSPVELNIAISSIGKPYGAGYSGGGYDMSALNSIISGQATNDFNRDTLYKYLGNATDASQVGSQAMAGSDLVGGASDIQPIGAEEHSNPFLTGLDYAAGGALFWPGVTASGAYDAISSGLGWLGGAINSISGDNEGNINNLFNAVNYADLPSNYGGTTVPTTGYYDMSGGNTNNTTNTTTTSGGTMGNLYDIPDPIQYPNLPSAEGVLSGIEQPGYIGYDIPDITSMMPTGDWFTSLSPEVMAGIWSPYEEGSRQLQEQLNAIGGLGNQVAGVSGQGAAGLGKYWADATNDVGLQAWNMISPALQTGWNAELTRNIGESDYLQSLADQLYQLKQNEATSDYEGSLETLRGNYNAMSDYRGDVLNQNMMPYQLLTGMLGGSYPDTVVSNNSSTGQNLLSGAGAGLAMYGLNNDNLWLTALGAML